MQLNYSYAKMQEDLNALCETPTTHTYHGLPFLLHKTAYSLAKTGNFAAYFIGQALFVNYTTSFDNANLIVRILQTLVNEGELYTDKPAFMKQFESHARTKLKPNTLLDAKRLGLNPLVIKAIDLADGGLIDAYLADNRGVMISVPSIGTTEHADTDYTGKLIITDTPSILTDTDEILISGTNAQTLETKIGQQAFGKQLDEMTGQSCTLLIRNNQVYLDAPKNYKQTKALNYLLDRAASLDRRSDEYASTAKLINILSHRNVLISTPDVYEYMTVRNQLADIAYGFDTGYITDAEFTQDPISAAYYTHCLSIALQAYNIICSETYTLEFEDNGKQSKDSVPDTGVDSETRS